MNFKTEMESENLKVIRGKIDWNSTILQSVNRGEKFPLSFTCVNIIELILRLLRIS